jgi:hypothetical protein
VFFRVKIWVHRLATRFLPGGEKTAAGPFLLPYSLFEGEPKRRFHSLVDRHANIAAFNVADVTAP